MPNLLPANSAARSLSPGPGEQPVARIRLSDDSLAAIAQRAAAGDHDAFEQLHVRFADGIRRFFQKRIGGDAADELAQHTWSELWRAVSKGAYQPERAAFSTFAYAVAGNVWRRSRRDASRTLPPVGQIASEDDLAGALAHAELLDALRACLHEESGELSEIERQIVLSMAAGESERDIARAQGVAASTVHDRKLAAMNKLRIMLAARGFGEQSEPSSE